MYVSSPVVTGGTVYGHSAKRKGQFVAFNPADGQIRWSTEGRSGTSASVIAAGKYLLIVTSATYAHPVLLRDRLVVRDATHVTVWGL
jgi:outer membrane protein assembly factor BamB